ETAAQALAHSPWAEGGVGLAMLEPAGYCLEALVARERGAPWRHLPLPAPAVLFLLGHTPGLFVRGAVLAGEAALAEGRGEQALGGLAGGGAAGRDRGGTRAGEALQARAVILAIRAGLMDDARVLARVLTENQRARFESALALAHFHLATETPLAARERLQ